MLSSFRDRFGTAGLVVAIVALVAALAGGAYAASGALTAKQKKEVKSIAKSFQGTGPAGAQGPAGPAGANGKDGANGSNGSNGAAGPTGPTGAKGSAGSAGAVGETGPTGATGPTGTFGGIALPTGVTETGFWAFSTPGAKTITLKDTNGKEEVTEETIKVGGSEGITPISFPDMVENASSYKPVVQGDPTFETTCGAGEGGVGGTLTEPKAPPGYLCIYPGGASALANGNLTLTAVCSKAGPTCGSTVETLNTRGMNQTGAFLAFKTVADGPGRAAGSWALTGL